MRSKVRFPNLSQSFPGKIPLLPILLVLAVSAQAALVTVTETVVNADNTNFTGYLMIDWPAFKTSAGEVIAGNSRGQRFPASGTFNGTVTAILHPTVGGSPSGVSYRVRYFSTVSALRSEERWQIPTSPTTTTIQAVRITTTPTPDVTILLGQIGQGGATDGQDMRWNNTTKVWEPKTLFDSTNPAASPGTAAPGTQVIAARRDHVHPAPTGTSGGILGYTSTTALASSALLALNGIVLGGGAGATPTATAAGAARDVLRVPPAGGAPAFGSDVPVCQKYTVNETDLTAAATTEDETLFNLPARGKIVGAGVKHSTAFAGTGITAVTVSVGDSSGTTFYTAAFDIFQAVADTTFQDTSLFKSSTYVARDVLARFTCTGGNCNAMTAGEVDFRICWVILP